MQPALIRTQQPLHRYSTMYGLQDTLILVAIWNSHSIVVFLLCVHSNLRTVYVVVYSCIIVLTVCVHIHYETGLHCGIQFLYELSV